MFENSDKREVWKMRNRRFKEFWVLAIVAGWLAMPGFVLAREVMQQ